MCGRYSLCQARDRLMERFDVHIGDEFKPKYNASPLQSMPVITGSNPTEFSFFSWGLVPNWSLNDKTAINLFNAKSELILNKSHFKQSIRSKRCLVIADGYYEWRREGKIKVPYRVTLANDEAFAFAGIWDSWESPKEEIINTFTIITRPSVGMLSDLHERMPVILPRDLEKYWIAKKLTDEDILSYIQSNREIKMSYYKVDRIVNSTTYDIPQCLQVAPKIYPGETYGIFE